MSRGTPERSLKSLNMKWLVMLATFDILAVMLFVVPAAAHGSLLSTAAAIRASAALVLPVVVLLLSGLMSHSIKAVLVYWKVKDPYPGCEAFTRYGPDDARVDMAGLKRNTGVLPTDPSEQNRKWFKLFKMVENEASVLEAHKGYLMFRDMAAMSVPLVLLVPAGLYVAGVSPGLCAAAAVVFLVQFMACCVAARNSGRRLICNVLAIHGSRKVKQPGAAEKAAKTVA